MEMEMEMGVEDGDGVENGWGWRRMNKAVKI